LYLEGSKLIFGMWGQRMYRLGGKQENLQHLVANRERHYGNRGKDVYKSGDRGRVICEVGWTDSSTAREVEVGIGYKLLDVNTKVF
jgi:hypothetical protein